MPIATPSSSPASRRGRIALAIAGAAAAVGGGAYYLLGVYLPGQERAVVQAEVARWEERLAEARACLLGPAPASPRTREALAVRELSPDPWSRGTCTRLIGALSRGEADDSGVPAVEAAWLGVERAAGAVAAAFLAHVDPEGEPVAGRNPDGLPGALDQLDAAHAALRAAAALPPAPARATAGPALAEARIVPLRDGAQPITSLESWSMPTMSSVVAFGRSAARELQLTLAPGAAPGVHPVGDGVLRAVPESAWGAGGALGQIAVGPLDAHGRLPAPAPAPGAAPAAPGPGAAPAAGSSVKVDGQGRVFAVAGTAADGLVVGGTERSLVLVRSRGGALAADPPVEIQQLAFAIDPSGRALVAYNDAGGQLRGFIARAGAAPAKVHDLGAAFAGGACLTAARGWIAGPGGDQILSFDEAGAVTPHAYERHDLLGCTAGAALLHRRGATHYVVCADACRMAALEGMRPSKIAAIAGDQVVAIAARDHVLGVWREQAPPAFYATGRPLEPKLALANGEVIDVIAASPDGLVIARVPAR